MDFDEKQFTCLIAAILTIGTFGPDVRSAGTVRAKYAQVLKELHDHGGVFEPSDKR